MKQKSWVWERDRKTKGKRQIERLSGQEQQVGHMYFRLADSMENCYFTQLEGLTSGSEAQSQHPGNES